MSRLPGVVGLCLLVYHPVTARCPSAITSAMREYEKVFHNALDISRGTM